MRQIFLKGLTQWECKYDIFNLEASFVCFPILFSDSNCIDLTFWLQIAGNTFIDSFHFFSLINFLLSTFATESQELKIGEIDSIIHGTWSFLYHA